nr:hypothetical protein GCM10025699_57960 [Microbacterium flavescens]
MLLAPAHLAVGRLARDIASVLDETAATLAEPSDHDRLDAALADARALRASQSRAVAAVTAGDESLQLNPRASRNRSVLEADGALLDRLTVVVNRVVGMVRSVHDNYDASLADDPVVQDIARDLRRAAHDVRLLARSTEEARPGPADPADSTRSTAPDDAPALTAPIRVLRPDPDNWVLVGSLLEDLRRVREEIIG